MKRCIFLLLWILTFQLALADGPVYLPVIFKGDSMAINPILRITNGTDVIDLLGNESGWELEDPYWNPQIAQYKSGGSYVNSGLAEGQRLVHKEYDNVIETIPLSAHGIDQNKSIQTVRRLLQMAKQASDYWTKSYEYDDVWIEARPACNDCLTGYARIVKMSIPEITNPYGQPFFSSFNDAILNGITLAVEREPLWRGLPPGEILGPMYNLLKNPDFELWNFGVADSQPDSWTDLETLQITGQNSRESTVPNSGQYALKVRVSGSTAAGKAKGVTQIVESTKNNTEYTVVAHVRSDGVSNGVGRILVTYSSQLEVYRASTRHGWALYTGKFTTGINDVVSINLEILTTAANTDGTIYIDSLMLLEGDFEEAAANGTLPYMTSSHVVNHWDQPGGALVEAGDINFVDVWNVPGDEDALVRLEVLNNTSIADPANVIENIASIRIGQRRTRNVTKFQNYLDPSGIDDTTASSDDYINLTPLSNAWKDVVTNLINDVGDNQGRFRVWSRVYDAKSSGSPNLEARLLYFVGSAGTNVKTLQAVTAQTRANWTMVELTPTAAMIQEYKYHANQPGQFGYTLQFRRSSGADAARLDYILLLPTDGGMITATVNPAIEPGAAFVVDGSGGGIQVGAAGINTGFYTVWDSGSAGASEGHSLASFNGYTYAGGFDLTTANHGVVYRRPSGQVGGWTLAARFPLDLRSYSLAVYNGKLYAGTGAGVSARVWSSSDGVSWASAYVPTSETFVFGLKSFDGFLWSIGLSRVGRWDGSSYVESIDFGGAGDCLIEVYAGKLYAFVNFTNELYVKRSGADIWSLVGTIPIGVNATVVFQQKLYIAGTRYVDVYDGSAITHSLDLGISCVLESITVLDDKLYAAGNCGALITLIYVTEDGVTWNQVYSMSINDMPSPYAMIGDVGNLVLVGASANSTFQIGTIVPDKPVQYEIADFQVSGGSFTAPPRRFSDPRRHRWVFSYDRENYINNADDKALIGLGYVPRYLTLRGAN